VFLDEPTGGVDPVSRRDFWELINELAESGVTVLVTTHYLDEAEYCTQINMIHEGRVVAQGSPAALKRSEITFPMWQVSCSSVTDAAAVLGRADWVVETSIFGTSLHVGTELSTREAPDRILAALTGSGVANVAVTEIAPSLEDVFIHVIRRSGGEP
jgi:ABC-2 type transport system ATP-binding protein